ncbi:MAG: tetratricopeptide repeat protein [Alphaproteobacteria bacterium]|nr:tetratricopeptide repeat protein [Alphaproteobacteria bacterium]
MARDRNNLGSVWQAKGEYDKAIGYYEQAMEIFRKFLPENHPNIKITQGNLSEAIALKNTEH